MSNTIVSKTKREFELQDIIMSIFRDYGHKTINEDLNKTHDSVLQEHQYLILSPLETLTKGLRHYIKAFNHHIIDDKTLLETHTQEELLSIIEKEFISAYNTSDYLGIYRLVFQEFSTKRDIEIDDKIFQYHLIDFQHPAYNELFIVKEKRIHKSNGGFEKPDFAIYMNGIPVFAIEVKTRKAGLNEAFKDYKNKKTYHKFIGCIGTDLDHTFISMDPTAPCTFQWKAYGDNKNKQQITQFNLEELLCEILPSGNPCAGLLFYIQNCSFILEGEGKSQIINHRCQQYYTVRKLDGMLRNIQTSKEDGKRDNLMREVVKHAQRSGKSITILSLVNLLATKYPTLFSKVYIFVPDLTILSVLKKAFGKRSIMGTGKPLQVIDKIRRYKKTIEAKEKGLTVYLMNIQKSRVVDKTYRDNDVLIIIDEVHTHQNGIGAEARDINFPLASFISFTATPRFKNLKGHMVDMTSNTYGTTPFGTNEIRYLDEFNMSDALELGIVAKLNYEKASISEEWNKEKSAEFEHAIHEETVEKIEQSYELRENLLNRQDDIISIGKRKLDKNEITLEDFEEIKVTSYDQAFEQIQRKLEKEAYSTTVFNITESMMEDKIHFIIDDINKKRDDLAFKEESKLPPFKTKALWFVQSTKVAKKIIDHVKSLSGSIENEYKGIRFGIDYSEQALYEESLGEYQQAKKEVDVLNGSYFYGDGVLSDFESQDTHAIDVLIVVGKYLMGYDLGTLMTVYLDTEIKEPSRFFQMATRPITNYPKKNIGYLVDMTMGETNYDTFLTSIKYYDNNDRMETFVLKSDDIDLERGIIEGKLKYISTSLLGVDDYRDIMKKEPEFYVELLINERDGSDQKSFFDQLKKINSSFNKLVSPEYYKEYIQVFSYLLIIAKIYHKEIFNKDDNERFLFDPKFISELIEDAMESLNITSFEQLARYDILGSNQRSYNQESHSVIPEEYSAESHLSFAEGDEVKEERGVSSIYDWLSNNSHKLDDSLERQLRKKKKEESGGKIEKVIREEFDGSEMFYWTFTDFIEKIEKKGKLPDVDSESQAVFKAMVKTMIGGIVHNVWDSLSKQLYSVDETDISLAIDDANSRGEDYHSLVTRYIKDFENKSDASKIAATYLKLFVDNDSAINSDLKDSIITSIQIRREDQ